MNPTYKANSRHRYKAVIDGKVVATAIVNDEGNYIRGLYVAAKWRRKGVATGLIAFIAEHRGRKLHRAPATIKNAAVKALSVKLGDSLLGEAKS